MTLLSEQEDGGECRITGTVLCAGSVAEDGNRFAPLQSLSQP